MNSIEFAHLENMRELLQSLNSTCHEARQPLPAEPCLIYGAGNKGKQVATFLLENGHAVIGFADASASGLETWRDLPIRRLADWLKDGAARDVTIVVAIHNHQVNMAQLLGQLKKVAAGRIINPIEFQSLYDGRFPDAYWLAGRNAYAGQDANLVALEELLADEGSRDLLRRVVEFRLTGNYAALPEPTPADQYSPTDLPRWPQPLRFVDAGAFTGDTLRHFRQRGYEFEAIVAFEPDPNNFGHLARCVEELGGGTCLPCGLSSTTRQLSFAAEGSGASRIADDGGHLVQCVALDEALPGFRPTLIKMDIEGAEPDALRGAARTIASSRPGLAISVYHHPAHLWEIPLLIHQWDLGYQFHLRMHGQSSFDLVLYAVPAGLPEPASIQP